MSIPNATCFDKSTTDIFLIVYFRGNKFIKKIVLSVTKPILFRN